jgi:nucleoside phosphorylase
VSRIDTIILVAWDNETDISLSDSDRQRLDDNNIEIVYTGIGKINATRVATDLCVRDKYHWLNHNAVKTGDYEDMQRRFKPLHIVNVGCAGSHTTGVRTLIKPNCFIQRDMDARQFGYGQYRTPEQANWIVGGDDLDHDLTVVCATGDNANGYSETSDEVPAFDAVDMEAYAFAHVCAYYRVSFTCYKWITDKAAEDSTIEELIENNKLLPWTQIIDEILLLD